MTVTGAQMARWESSAIATAGVAEIPARGETLHGRKIISTEIAGRTREHRADRSQPKAEERCKWVSGESDRRHSHDEDQRFRTPAGDCKENEAGQDAQ